MTATTASRDALEIEARPPHRLLALAETPPAPATATEPIASAPVEPAGKPKRPDKKKSAEKIRKAAKK